MRAFRVAVAFALMVPVCSAWASGDKGLDLNEVEPVTTIERSPLVSPSATPDPTASTCSWESVARKFQVNPVVLYAIAKTESSLNPSAVNRANQNGSEDVGMMQINSFWYPHLAKFGIGRADLFKPCVSLEVAAWILAQNMDRHGNTWKAIGAYNASSPTKQQRYAERVYRNLPHGLH